MTSVVSTMKVQKGDISSRKKDVAITKHPFKMYSFFLMLLITVHNMAGASFSHGTFEDVIGYVSCIIETCGLICMRQKIEKKGSVEGISGMTMIMFLLSYTLREVETVIMMTMHTFTVDGIILEMMQFVSLPLVIDILYLIGTKYRSSYQEDLDVLKVKYLIPGCVALAFVLHPRFMQGFGYSYCWTVSFYVDVLALLRQVIMMTRGNGKVEAPIANFVAATAFSRIVDLCFWYLRFDLGRQGWMFGFNYSGYLIVFWHLVSLALVADFLYYFLKAKFSGSTLMEDTTLEII